MSEKKPPAKKRKDKRWVTTREKILDAAIRCYQQNGAMNTSLQDIIGEAQISKPTLYRHFNNHDEVMSEAIYREFEQVVHELEAIQSRQHNISDMIIESFMFCLQEFPRRPLLKLLSQRQQLSQLSHLGLNADNLVGQATRFSQPIYELAEQQGALREGVTLKKYVEWGTRIIMSYMNLPAEEQNDAIEMRLLLKRFLVSSLIKDEF